MSSSLSAPKDKLDEQIASLQLQVKEQQTQLKDQVAELEHVNQQCVRLKQEKGVMKTATRKVRHQCEQLQEQGKPVYKELYEVVREELSLENHFHGLSWFVRELERLAEGLAQPQPGDRNTGSPGERRDWARIATLIGTPCSMAVPPLFDDSSPASKDNPKLVMVKKLQVALSALKAKLYDKTLQVTTSRKLLKDLEQDLVNLQELLEHFNTKHVTLKGIIPQLTSHMEEALSRTLQLKALVFEKESEAERLKLKLTDGQIRQIRQIRQIPPIHNQIRQRIITSRSLDWLQTSHEDVDDTLVQVGHKVSGCMPPTSDLVWSEMEGSGHRYSHLLDMDD